MKLSITDNENQRNLLYILGAVTALFFISGLLMYQDKKSSMTGSESRLSKIAEKPQEFIGKEVTVTGQIANLLGSRAFSLDSPNTFDTNVLVISKVPLIPVGGSGEDQTFYNEQERVKVVGNVSSFDIKVVEEELGVDLVDEQFVDWEGRPFIFADSVVEDK